MQIRRLHFVGEAVERRIFPIGFRGHDGVFVACACWVQGMRIICIYAPRRWEYALMRDAARDIHKTLTALLKL